MVLHTFDPNGDLLLLLPGIVETKQQKEQNKRVKLTHASASERCEAAIPNDQALKMDQDPPLDIHMLVSSKHMMLGSSVFAAMLQHSNFKEGRTLQSTGRVEVPLSEDDPIAFIILLNAIHGRTRKIP